MTDTPNVDPPNLSQACEKSPARFVVSSHPIGPELDDGQQPGHMATLAPSRDEAATTPERVGQMADPPAAPKLSVADRRVKVAELHELEVPIREMARVLNVSRNTIRADLKSLTGAAPSPAADHAVNEVSTDEQEAAVDEIDYTDPDFELPDPDWNDWRSVTSYLGWSLARQWRALSDANANITQLAVQIRGISIGQLIGHDPRIDDLLARFEAGQSVTDPRTAILERQIGQLITAMNTFVAGPQIVARDGDNLVLIVRPS